jgi:hypothetical protein
MDAKKLIETIRTLVKVYGGEFYFNEGSYLHAIPSEMLKTIEPTLREIFQPELLEGALKIKREVHNGKQVSRGLLSTEETAPKPPKPKTK